MRAIRKERQTSKSKDSNNSLIKSSFGNLKGKKILKLDLWNEVNNTKILFWVAEQEALVYGLDISGYLVKEAKKSFSKKKLPANFTKGDMRKMPFRNNFFDYIYSMGTIEHVPDYDKALKEIYRVLKPHGIAIIGVPNKFDPFLRPLIVWITSLIGKYPYAPEKSFTIWELEKEVSHVGFKTVSRTGILFMPGILRIIDLYFYKRIPMISRIVGLFLKLLFFLDNKFSFFARNGYLIAVVVQK